jgi:hypothetical protein
MGRFHQQPKTAILSGTRPINDRKCIEENAGKHDKVEIIVYSISLVPKSIIKITSL